MSRRIRTRRLVAALVLAGSWLPALASIVVAWAFDLPREPVPGAFLSASPPIVQSRFDDIGVTVALIYGALSAALIVRRPHPVAIITAVHAVGSGIAALGVQWGLLGERVDGLPGWGLLLHAAGWGYIPGTVCTTIIPLLVLRGARPRGSRVLIALGLALAGIAFAAGLTHQAPGAPRNPFAIPAAGYQALLVPAYTVAVTAAVGLSIVVAIALAVRWAGRPPEGRRRLGWLVVGHSFLTLSYGALVLPAELDLPRGVWDFGMIAPVVGQIFYPSAVLVLVLGRRLRGVDVAVSSVLSWSILTVLAVSTYLVLETGLSALLPWPAESIGVLAASAVAIALIPAHDPIRRRVAALVWDEDGDPEELVRRLGERVGELDSGAHGLTALAAALRAALRLGRVEIASVAPKSVRAESGSTAEEGTRLALCAGGTQVGWLAVAPRRGEALTPRVRSELEELAPVVAVVLRLAQAGATLEAARDSVIAVRHGERRAMRRELHDGIGPALAGAGFGLAAVERLIDSDPEEARALLTRLDDDLRSRVREVESLVRATREEETVVDLGADLAELARDFSAAGPDVRVATEDPDGVPRTMRRTLYLIAAEAVLNAVRHAAAREIDVRLRADDDVVELAVSDDGRGLGARRADGVGLATMRERAAELGAPLELVERPGGGLVVRVRAGLARHPADSEVSS